MSGISERVRAMVYKTTVYDSVGDWVHGGGRQLLEVFIPSAKTCFNSDRFFIIILLISSINHIYS